MPDLSRRERKKKDTYDKLFSSAMYLFRSQGFEETSIEQITQYADVGKGTFYNYFPSKEAVILEYSRKNFQDIFQHGRETAGYSIRERLETILVDWAGLMIKDRELSWIAVKNRDRAELDLTLHYGLRAVITLGQRSGEINAQFDSAFLAESLEGMMIQHFITWYVTGEGDLQQEMHYVLSVFLDGLMIKQLEA